MGSVSMTVAHGLVSHVQQCTGSKLRQHTGRHDDELCDTSVERLCGFVGSASTRQGCQASATLWTALPRPERRSTNPFLSCL